MGMFETFSSFNVMPAKLTKKLLWVVLHGEVVSYLLHNYTGAIFLWVKAQSNDFSAELT